MTNAYFYSSTAVQTQLSGGISNSSTTVQVASTVGWPSSYPFVVSIDYGAAAEELVVVTNNSLGVLTVTRGFDSTSAQSHSIGAVVRHVYCANDATAFRTHEAAVAAIHGVAGTIVGTTDTQTLSNKTLTSPIVNTPTETSPTVSGAATFTSTGTGIVPVMIKGFSGQTADVLSIQNSGSTPLFRVLANGNALINNQLTSAVALTLNSPTATSADLQDWQVNGVTVSFVGSTGILHSPGIVETGVMAGQPSALANTVLSSNLNGVASFDNFRLLGDGTMQFGPGTGARDTNLYRSAAGTLKTDTAFVAGGNVTSGGIVAGLTGNFTPVATSGIIVQANAPATFGGQLFVGTLNGAEEFSVLQNGSIFGSAMLVGEGEDATAGRTTTSTTYTSVGTLTATCIVPESGKVLVTLRVTCRNSTTNNSITSFNAVGSTSGSRYAANDAASVIVTGTGNLSMSIQKVISGGVSGETLTVTPQHRVNSASTMTIDYRDIVMMPLLA